MDKIVQVQLLLEFIAYSQKTPKDIQKVYTSMLQILEEYELYTKSIFTCKQIEQILKDRAKLHINEYEMAKYHLSKLLHNNKLQEEKKSIFHSLMASNFQAKAEKLKKSKEDFEASLSKVEAKMYTMISLYIELFLASLDVFTLFSSQHQKSVENITSFSILIHDALIKNIFYEEERKHIELGLKQLSVVYIGLYCKEFFMQNQPEKC